MSYRLDHQRFAVVDADTGERIRPSMFGDPHQAFRYGDSYVYADHSRDYVVLDLDGNAVPRSAIGFRQ